MAQGACGLSDWLHHLFFRVLSDNPVVQSGYGIGQNSEVVFILGIVTSCSVGNRLFENS
jgi:hypothetical protein